MITLQKRKVKKGYYYRMIYRINKKQYTEKINIIIFNQDPDRKIKMDMINRVVKNKYIEIGADQHQLIKSTQESFVSYYGRFIDTANLAGIHIYKNNLKYLRAFFKNKPMKDVTRSDLRNYLDYLYSKVAIVTGNHYFLRTRRVLAHAADERLIPFNPADGIRKRPSPTQKIKDVIFIDEFRELLKHELCETDNGLKEACIFAYYTGMGLKDIRSLTWNNIRGGRLHYRRGKTESDVIIPLKDWVIDQIPGKDKLFPNLPHESQVRKLLIRWAERANINKHLTFYCWRHSFAVNLLKNGSDPVTVAKYLGHSGLKNVMKYLAFIKGMEDDSPLRLPDL